MSKLGITSNSNIRIYQSDDGKTEINVQVDNETVWLSLNQITELFEQDKSFVSKYINNIFKKKELSKKATIAKYTTAQTRVSKNL